MIQYYRVTGFPSLSEETIDDIMHNSTNCDVYEAHEVAIDAEEAVKNFDVEDLLDEIGEDKVQKWLNDQK